MISSKTILLVFFSLFCLLTYSDTGSQHHQPQRDEFPWRRQGLTERQAAAHLLSRFTYGVRKQDIDEALSLGLENWFDRQLNGAGQDTVLDRLLLQFDCLRMTNAELVREFPKPIQVARMARAEGVLPDDSLRVADEKKYRQILADYVRQKKIRPQGELFRQFFNARVLRATYSKNQLHEVMTEFWFNHFNVSMTKRPCALYIPTYERDAIRPFVTGRFGDMLMATARHPAMLIYLDNFISAGDNSTFDDDRRRLERRLKAITERAERGDSSAIKALARLRQAQRDKGLNENYAREVMELHTLGVDGGYSQQDVTEAARVLTGWTIYPMEDGANPAIRNIINKIGEDRLAERGFVREGDFLFAASRHDDRPKSVLGKQFDGTTGYQEGVQLLQMLAAHQSTAKFIARKLAARFVQDQPPASLIDKMARSFSSSGGNISEVLRTMVRSDEFWSPSAVRSKTKSPFELVISALRVLEADVEAPAQVFRITEKMGQKMYHYAAPTGFPDRADFWINSGALLNRMNFGLSISSQQVRGVFVDLLSLNNNHEPESAQEALRTYCRILMPERDPEPTIRRLTPMLTRPDLAGRIRSVTDGNQVPRKTDNDQPEEWPEEKPLSPMRPQQVQQMLAQVVGIIIGSPEFQRR